MRDLVEDIQTIQLSADGAAITDSIHEMQRLAHEITGGGGTFGCPKLSEIAAEMEAHLACCAAGKRGVDDVILLKYLDRLKSAIEMACGLSKAVSVG
jgi:chemotaxis protein histidine kinase CheA